MRENFARAYAFKLAGVDTLACGFVRVPASERECLREFLRERVRACVYVCVIVSVCVSAWVLQ